MSEEQTETPVVTENEAPQVDEQPVAKRSQIDNLEDALKVINQLRDENAAKRVANKAKDTEMEEKAAKWQAHLDSQKTELQLLQERNVKLEETLAEKTRLQLQRDVAKSVGLDEDLVEFITGSDETEMRAKAEKLAGRVPMAPPLDLKAGERGGPVVPKRTSGGEFLLSLSDSD